MIKTAALLRRIQGWKSAKCVEVERVVSQGEMAIKGFLDCSSSLVFSPMRTCHTSMNAHVK